MFWFSFILKDQIRGQSSPDFEEALVDFIFIASDLTTSWESEDIHNKITSVQGHRGFIAEAGAPA